MAFEVPSIDTLLSQIFADYAGQLDRDGNPIDISKGSTTWIDSSVLASALQGIYYRLKYTEQQALPNLPGAKTATIDKWAAIFGITRDAGDTDADVVQKIINRIQQPPAGGNENDWIGWAKEIVIDHENSDDTEFAEAIISACVVENGRRPGSVDLYMLSDWSAFPAWSVSQEYDIGDHVRYTESGIERIWVALSLHTGQEPDSLAQVYWKLLEGCTDVAAAAAQTLIESEKRALGIWDNQYQAAGIVPVNVTATITGDVNDIAAEAVIAAYIDSSPIAKLNTDIIISMSKITTYLDELGATTVSISVPSGNVTLNPGEKAVAGEINVIVT